MLSTMEAGNVPKPEWSAEALDRMENIPEFIRGDVKSGIEEYAVGKGYRVITQAVIEESKTAKSDMEWSEGAEARLNKVPFFIRPMVRKEIERMARELGTQKISDGLMDEARKKFEKFMGG
jgi:hypothetical protein